MHFLDVILERKSGLVPMVLPQYGKDDSSLALELDPDVEDHARMILEGLIGVPASLEAARFLLIGLQNTAAVLAGAIELATKVHAGQAESGVRLRGSLKEDN